jgi:nitroreductase
VTRIDVVPTAAVRRIVEEATRAPSVHNTQPWRWRSGPASVELIADASRRLPATDLDGRSMVISCGAALHHAQVAASALGWATAVTRFPDPSRTDLLARLDLSPAPPRPDGAELLDTLRARCTDRRRFTSWPVPPSRLRHLADVARQWDTGAAALVDPAERFRSERLVMEAAELQQARRDAIAERDAWLDHSLRDGVPSAALVDSGVLADAYPHRFEAATDPELRGQDLAMTDGLVVLFGVEDDPPSWLRAGEGLSAMWMAAAAGGLSMVPLSQVTEVDRTRQAFRTEVLHGFGHPLILTRVGWQAIGRSDLVRTPRRPLDEVLEVT